MRAVPTPAGSLGGADLLPWRVRRSLRHLRERAARPNPEAVVVFGNQKSGTSAVAGLLGQLTGRSVTLDLELEWRAPSYQRVWQGDMPFSAFVRRNARGLSRDIVKEPNLLLLWPEYLQHFPAVRKVLVVRDPRDNLRSLLDRLGVPGDRQDLSPADRVANGPGWELYLSGDWLGLGERSYLEVMAWRWNLGAAFWAANRADTVLVRYEDFLADKEGVLRRTAQAVGLSPIHSVADALDRPFQPAGRGNRSWLNVFGGANLRRIETACAAGMREFGYDPVT